MIGVATLTDEDFRKTLVALPYPVLIHTMDRIVFANLAACRALDAGTPAALEGLHISAISHADTKVAGAERRRVVIDNQVPVCVTLKLLTLEGRACRATAWARPFNCSGQDYIAVMAAVENHTGQIESPPIDEREPVTVPEGLFEQAMESLSHACVLHDHDTLFYANEAARRFFGFAPEDVAAGPSITELTHPDGLSSAGERTRFVMQTGQPMCDVPLKLVRKDGSVVSTLGNGTRVDLSRGISLAVVLLP